MSNDIVPLMDTECHTCDIDMAQITAENERKLAAMSGAEILDKQQQLLSSLGIHLLVIYWFFHFLLNCHGIC